MARYGYEPGVGCAAYRPAAARGVQHSDFFTARPEGGSWQATLVTAEF
jgi:hypothetical protein